MPLNTDTGVHFVNITPVTQTLRASINKCNLLKQRSFCKAKNKVNRTKQQPSEWDKIFTNPTSDRKLIFKVKKRIQVTRHQNTKQSNLKRRCRFLRILNRRISNGQKTFKELLNTISYLGIANQNDSEIPSYTGKDA